MLRRGKDGPDARTCAGNAAMTEQFGWTGEDFVAARAAGRPETVVYEGGGSWRAGCNARACLQTA